MIAERAEDEYRKGAHAGIGLIRIGPGPIISQDLEIVDH